MIPPPREAVAEAMARTHERIVAKMKRFRGIPLDAADLAALSDPRRDDDARLVLHHHRRSGLTA